MLPAPVQVSQLGSQGRQLVAARYIPLGQKRTHYIGERITLETNTLERAICINPGSQAVHSYS